MPPSNTLVGYAVLRANYNAKAPSYLDNFQGFVLSALSQGPTTGADRSTISRTIRDQYGLNIPTLVIGRLLKRTRKSELTVQVSPETHKLTAQGESQAPAIRELAVQYRRQQAELESHFRSFVEARHPDHLDLLKHDIGVELASYFERHSVPLLRQSLQGVSPSSSAPTGGFDYLISHFVTALADTDQVRFGYVEEASKGAILASVLTLDTLASAQSLAGVALYLDTPVVMNALGYHGDVLEASTAELIKLAQSQGAKLRTFEHSSRELGGILDAAQSSLRSGSRSLSTSAAYLLFAERGYSASDVAIMSRRLNSDIRALGIEVVPKPQGYAEYGLDESLLEELLQEKVRYHQQTTRVFDVESISAIHRLRRNFSSRFFEECQAVLVTSNANLVVGANAYQTERDQFPLVMTEEAVAGLLWVQSSAVDEKTSRQLLLSSAWAGMQPTGNLWNRYLEQVDELEKREAVSTEEAIILRSTSTARAALMEETLGDTSELEPESPLAVLDRIRSDHAVPIFAERDEANARAAEASSAAESAAVDWLKQVSARESAELAAESSGRERDDMQRRLEEIESKQERQLRKLTTDAERFARRLVRGAAIVLLAIVLVGVLGPMLGLPLAISPIGAVLATTAGVVVAALALVRAFLPGTVFDWLRPMESKIARNRLRSRLRALGLEGAG